MAGYTNNFEGLWSLADHQISAFSLENQRFALGVSGGADSIGLFHVFCSFLKQKKISDLVVFHINFGLRGDESDGDEAFVRSLCEANKVKFHVYKPDSPITSSIQENARAFRVSIQDSFISRGFLIALAHNSDDVAETVLMRLARGSAPENAAGMTYFDGKIFRPWLDASRARIRDAMRAMSYPWRDDSSNSTSYYARNRIRHDVLPVLDELFPGAADRIARSFLSCPSGAKIIPAADLNAVPMANFSRAALSTIEDMVHGLLEARYEGRSPVSRQVISQISRAIHKMSTGLDGEPRDFSLPQGVTVRLTARDFIINTSK